MDIPSISKALSACLKAMFNSILKENPTGVFSKTCSHVSIFEGEITEIPPVFILTREPGELFYFFPDATRKKAFFDKGRKIESHFLFDLDEQKIGSMEYAPPVFKDRNRLLKCIPYVFCTFFF